MASVRSLGMHPPLGIEGQPVEGKYIWDVVADDGGEDELLTIGNCVIWRRGGVFRKSFNLDIEKDEPVLQALLTYFPTNEADNHATVPKSTSMNQSAAGRGKHSARQQNNTLAKALVVFLKTQAHIFFLSGTSHIVHMPFEVESACAAPVGVIIQRKPRTHNLAPVSLRFPRVPPNSFVSSQLSPPLQRQHNPTASFSVEGLAVPKQLPLRLNTTMENMFDAPLGTNDSQWPRLVCLTDPLQELGLVVGHTPASDKGHRPRSSPTTPFLDLSEEILHVETVEHGLVLAVTANREANQYTVWQLTYIQNEDIFTKHQKKRGAKINRRRSSMQPRLSSGTTTPILPSFRESVGAPPHAGKKNRRSDQQDKSKPDDIAAALGAESEGDKVKRQSRRVSSLLARADLSASHERTTFAEPPVTSTHSENRRVTGAQRARQSGGPSSLHLSGMYSTGNPSNLRGAEDLLDELRAGGDFEGFHSMGLEDHSFDGLTREMLLTKVHSVSIDNTNVRYSLSTQPARTQYRVFLVNGPPFATDDLGRRDLLIGIQDPLDKRLQLLPLCIERHGRLGQSDEGRGSTASVASSAYKITPSMLTRASSVVDSYKVFDGDQSMILILSENKEGQRELSIQAPWSAMTPLALPVLYADNLGSLEYTGTHVNRKVKGRRSAGSKITATDITRIRHARLAGVVDLEDKEGKIHRIQIQLQPASPQVRKLLQACRSVLPTESSEKMLAGWWHIMNWMEEENIDTADREWSSLMVEIFAIFLPLAAPSAGIQSLAPPSKPRQRRSLETSAGSYAKMLPFTSPNASACPPWAQSRAWRWMVEEETPAITPSPVSSREDDFMTTHIRLAKLYMESPRGQHALGASNGHLPTALNRGPEDRIGAAWGIICALHLSVEEGKLDSMAPEFFPPARANLSAVLCQVGRWLRWHDFVALHELGMQADLDPRNDHGKRAAPTASVKLTFGRSFGCRSSKPRTTSQHLSVDSIATRRRQIRRLSHCCRCLHCSYTKECQSG